jgi:hypothetical protein
MLLLVDQVDLVGVGVEMILVVHIPVVMELQVKEIMVDLDTLQEQEVVVEEVLVLQELLVHLLLDQVALVFKFLLQDRQHLPELVH